MGKILIRSGGIQNFTKNSEKVPCLFLTLGSHVSVLNVVIKTNFLFSLITHINSRTHINSQMMEHSRIIFPDVLCNRFSIKKQFLYRKSSVIHHQVLWWDTCKNVHSFFTFRKEPHIPLFAVNPITFGQR